MNMTREEFEYQKEQAIEDLESAAESISSAVNVEYDTDDSLSEIIDKAEGDLELIKSYVNEFENQINELKELKGYED